jgi:hypothetical protein
MEQELSPGVLLTVLPNCWDAVVAWELEDEEWEDEKNFDKKWYTTISITGQLPALVNRRNVPTIEQISLGWTEDFTQEINSETFDSNEAVEILEITEDGYSRPTVEEDQLTIALTFRPGGTNNEDYVFNSFASLYSRFTALRAQYGVGLRMKIIIDDRVQTPAVIPAATYELSNTVLSGIPRGGTLDFGISYVEIGDGVILNDLFEYDQIQVNHVGNNSPVAIESGDVVVLSNDADITSLAGNSASFFDASAVDGGLGQFFTIRMTDQASFGRGGQTYEMVELGTNAICLLQLSGSSIFNKRSIRGQAGCLLALELKDQGSLFGSDQNDFLGTIDRNFGSAIKGPRLALTPTTPIRTADYTITNDGVVLVDVSGGPVTITLPNLPGSSFDEFGRPLVVKEISGNAGLTVAPNTGDTIDGAASSVAIPAGGSIWFTSDGQSAWYAL